jgi:hypothetical protein
VEGFTTVMAELCRSKAVQKLGEGTFKEVFACDPDVISVMPIEGNTVMNEEVQKAAHEVIPEVLAHQLLSDLRRPTSPAGDADGAFPRERQAGRVCHMTSRASSSHPHECGPLI